MFRLLIRWVLNALALILIAYVLPGLTIQNFWTALLAAIVIGLVNTLIRPVVSFLTLPLTLLTLGLFHIVVNALMFWLASIISPGFHIDAFFWTAVVASLVYSILTSIITSATKHPSEERRVAAHSAE